MLRVKVNFICNYTVIYDMQEIVLQFAYISAYVMISHPHFPCSIHPDPLHIPKIAKHIWILGFITDISFLLCKVFLFLSYLYILFHFKCHFHKKLSSIKIQQGPLYTTIYCPLMRHIRRITFQLWFLKYFYYFYVNRWFVCM